MVAALRRRFRIRRQKQRRAPLVGRFFYKSARVGCGARADQSRPRPVTTRAIFIVDRGKARSGRAVGRMAISVRLLLPEGDSRRWHKNLCDALLRDGADVSAEWRPGPPRPLTLTLLEELERLLLGPNRAKLLEPQQAWSETGRASERADLVFDLTGRAIPEAGSIFPTFNGATGEHACDSMLLDGVFPCVELVQIIDDQPLSLAAASPAFENRHVFRCRREAVAGRLSLLVRSVTRSLSKSGEVLSHRRPFSSFESSAAVAPTAGAASLLDTLALRAQSRLRRLLLHENHWRIAWRRLADPADAVQARLGWADATWRWLEDDRRRYYADPFLFEKDGVVHLFCEEYPYATGKGVISWCPLDSAGAPLHSPQVVLEESCHLSYPLIFRHGGDIWMMPESSGARDLRLYRADPFPQRWTLDRVLLEDFEIADATWFEHERRFWLTGATREETGSFWDCLSLFVGDSPLGPWRRCGEGPVLIDASAARPAGHLFHREGRL